MKNKINNLSWNLYLDKVNTYSYWEKVFTKEECEKIIKIAKNKGLTKGTTRSKDETDVRQSQICWLYAFDNLEWVFKKITDIVLNLNSRFFNFDIFGLNEGLQFTNYKAPSNKYGKHIDKGLDNVIRKLSLSIQLTNPKEYEGGELFIHNQEQGIKLDYGDVVAFPSNFMFPHSVDKITKGTRWSIVSWLM